MSSTGPAELKNTQIKTFNNSEFVVEIKIAETESGIIQSYYKDQVLRIHFDNDILEYYCKGYVLLKDVTNFYTLLANNIGKWSISFTIIQTESLNMVPSAEFKKEFNITATEIEEITPTHATVRISFADAIEQIFNRNSVYASQNDADISQVLTGLLSSIGFRKGDSSIVGIPQIDSCGMPFNYITDNNNTALRHIDYVASQVYNKEKGFLFLYFHPTENKLKTFWSKDILNNSIDLTDDATKYENLAYVLNIASSENTSRGEENVAEIKAYTNIIPFNNASRIIYPTYIQDFNVKSSRMEVPDSGVWSSKTFKQVFEQSNKMNTVVPENIEEPTAVFATLMAFYSTAPEYAVGKFYRQSNVDEFRQRLRSYFVYKNMISFKLLGKIWRQPGHVYEIIYNQKPNSEKLAGKWLCTRIINSFESQQYYQYIFLTRISDMVDYESALEYAESIKNAKISES